MVKQFDNLETHNIGSSSTERSVGWGLHLVVPKCGPHPSVAAHTVWMDGASEILTLFDKAVHHKLLESAQSAAPNAHQSLFLLFLLLLPPPTPPDKGKGKKGKLVDIPCISLPCRARKQGSVLIQCLRDALGGEGRGGKASVYRITQPSTLAD